MSVNAKQQKTIDYLIANVLTEQYGSTAASYEIKFTKVNSSPICDDFVSLTIETGMIGDEGTAASILCRTYRHIFIGVAGGCELANPLKKGRTINRGVWHCLHNLVKN